MANPRIKILGAVSSRSLTRLLGSSGAQSAAATTHTFSEVTNG